MARRDVDDDERPRVPWRCGRHPQKRCYATMRAAEYAADWMRRRESDAHLVRIFTCADGGHLHVGHDTEWEPPHPREVEVAPLTWTPELPAHLVALVQDGPEDDSEH